MSNGFGREWRKSRSKINKAVFIGFLRQSSGLRIKFKPISNTQTASAANSYVYCVILCIGHCVIKTVSDALNRHWLIRQNAKYVNEHRIHNNANVGESTENYTVLNRVFATCDAAIAGVYVLNFAFIRFLFSFFSFFPLFFSFFLFLLVFSVFSSFLIFCILFAFFSSFMFVSASHKCEVYVAGTFKFCSFSVLNFASTKTTIGHHKKCEYIHAKFGSFPPTGETTRIQFSSVR